VFIPPFEDVFILHIFRHAGEVACKFIECAKLKRAERW
jgi:hypothetical protein